MNYDDLNVLRLTRHIVCGNIMVENTAAFFLNVDLVFFTVVKEFMSQIT